MKFTEPTVVYSRKYMFIKQLFYKVTERICGKSPHKEPANDLIYKSVCLNMESFITDFERVSEQLFIQKSIPAFGLKEVDKRKIFFFFLLQNDMSTSNFFGDFDLFKALHALNSTDIERYIHKMFYLLFKLVSE